MDTERHRHVYVDIETGGTDINRHPIIELAAIAVDVGSWLELDTFEAKVEFNVKDADPEALGVNKFTPSAWEQYALPPRDVAEKFSAFCRRHATVKQTSRNSKAYSVAQIAGHNAESFDGPFLHHWYQELGIFFPATRRVLCTKQRAMWLFEENQGLPPPKNFKLRTLCNYFGLPLPDHTALNDIRATVGLARHIAELSALAAKAA